MLAGDLFFFPEIRLAGTYFYFGINNVVCLDLLTWFSIFLFLFVDSYLVSSININ